MQTDTLTVAHVSEIFRTPSTDERLKLLSRCLERSAEAEEELREQIWLNMLLKVLLFCKEESLSPTRAHAFVGVMASLHAHAVETKCSKADAFDLFRDKMLGATKALPPTERFSLLEVQALTSYAQTSYLDSIKLHQLVFSEEQTVRQSAAELFLQTPAAPPPLASSADPPPEEAEAPAEAAAEGEAAAEDPAVDISPEGEPAAEEGAAEGAASNDALTEAISATISSQVAAHQSQLAAEFATQEQQLLDRIGALETKLAK